MNKYRVRMNHAFWGDEKMVDVVAANPGVAAIEALLKNPHFSVLGVQWLKPDEPLDTASTAHVDRSGASVKMDNGATMHFTSGAADPLKSADLGNRRFWVLPLPDPDEAPHKWAAAVATLEDMGYSHTGGMRWRPPLGKRPDFPAADLARRLLSELLAVIHRDGGHYEQTHGTEKAVADAMVTLATERSQPDPRDEFEAARATNARHLLEMKAFREGDAYQKHLKHLNVMWIGWKLARGIK